MVLKNAPAAFDRVVLAVIGWVIGQPNRDAIVPYEIDEALHTLRAAAMVFRPIVEIDDQRRHLGKALTDRLPPLGQTIHQAVAGHVRSHAVAKELSQRGQENPSGCHSRFRSTIVLGCRDRYAALAAPSKRPDFDRGLGVDGKA